MNAIEEAEQRLADGLLRLSGVPYAVVMRGQTLVSLRTRTLPEMRAWVAEEQRREAREWTRYDISEDI